MLAAGNAAAQAPSGTYPPDRFAISLYGGIGTDGGIEDFPGL